MENKRLYRSRTDKVIGGVSGGLAEYMNIDPVIVRILFVLLVLFGGSGVLVYIILWIVIPEKPVDYGSYFSGGTGGAASDADSQEAPADQMINRRANSGLIAGILLIAFGLLILADRLMPMYNVWDFWPLLLVGAGILLIKPEIFNSSKNLES